MRLTLGQAAKQANISKSYLSRLVKAGKISAERMENGELRIDPSELDRLADIRPKGNSDATSDATEDEQPSGTPIDNTNNTMLDTARQREIALLREMLHDKDQVIEDIKQERDEWRRQAREAQRTQTLLLAEGRSRAPWWWPWTRKTLSTPPPVTEKLWDPRRP